VKLLRTGLIFLGVVLFLSGCRRESDFLLTGYRKRNLVQDGKGNQYRIVFKERVLYGSEISVYRSTDGKGWERVSRIPIPEHEVYEAWGYSLVSDGRNTFALVYIGTGKGKKAVYFTKSLDNCNTWTEPVPVNEDVPAQRNYPVIAMEGKNIFVAWSEEKETAVSGECRASGIYFCSSNDGGENWGEDIRIGEGEDLSIGVGPDGTIWLVYVGGERKNIIFLSCSKDRGKNWHTETTGELPVMVREPHIIFAGRTIYLIFQGASPAVFRPLEYHVFYLKSEDGGKSWSKIIRIKEKEVDDG